MKAENENSACCELESPLAMTTAEPLVMPIEYRQEPQEKLIQSLDTESEEVCVAMEESSDRDAQISEPSLTSAALAAGDPIQTNVFYYLRSAMSRKCIDIDNKATTERTKCLQQGFRGASNQIWKLIKTAENYYQFVPWVAPTMRLTVLDGGDTQGGSVGIMTASATLTSQDWELTKSSRGNYVFRSRCSNGNKVLCVNGSNGGKDSGAPIIQYTYSDDDAWTNDEWQLEPYLYPNNKVEAGTNYCIKCAMSDKYLDVDNGGTGDGANCIQYHFNGQNNQIWFVTQSTTSGYYQLAPRHAKNMRLTVLGGDNAEGANVGLKTATAGLAAQDWKIEKSDRGNFLLWSRCSGNSKVLCVNGNQGWDDGGNVIQYSYTAVPDGWLNSQWVFEPFVYPYMEFDQGFFMHNSGYSEYGMKNALTKISDKMALILSREFGLKFHDVVCKMISSIADDCGCVFYNCEHGDAAACTNTYLTESDNIHQKNFYKLLTWYKKQGAYPNSLQTFWAGHPKCLQETDASGAIQHSYFGVGEKWVSRYYYNDHFILFNEELATNANYLIAYLLSAASQCYGCKNTVHSALCIMDPAVRKTDVYNAVMGEHPTQSSFWCPACRAESFNNISELSKTL